LTSDGRPYGPVRFEQIVEECYTISKQIHTSYIDLLKITPAERTHLIQLIKRDLERENEIRDRARQAIKT
jgi:hypothetical protein